MSQDLIKNKILEFNTGSHLYGTNTAESDRDVCGIFMPNIDYILGFKRCEEIDCSIKDKIDGKNTKDAVDKKYYEFRKFIKLALDNNPNILEMLFVNDENILYTNKVGRKLLSMCCMFPHRGLKQKFLGYAFSQKHKMIIKKDNYYDLRNTINYLSKFNSQKLLAEIITRTDLPYFIKGQYDKNHNVRFIRVGDLNIVPSKNVAQAMNIIQDRLDKVGNREELVLKYGYDTKFASHLIRLMLEGIELLTTGALEFPLKEKTTILSIKNGNWKVEDIFAYSEYLEHSIEAIEKKSPLPKKPQIQKIENYCISELQEWLNG